MTPPRPVLSLRDILFVIFRHKWKIMLISSAGVLAALALFLAWPVSYQSEARLFIKYVVDARTPGPGANESKMKSPDERGESVISTELEILTSFDLAQEVARAIGPANILARTGGGTNEFEAAAVIRKGLSVDVPRRGSVIHLTFQHFDSQLVQSVLGQVLETYYRKHIEIHRPVGYFDDFLQKQNDQLRAGLLETEEQLRQAKAKAGVISLEDTKKLYGEQMAKIREQLDLAEGELAERQAASSMMARMTGAKLPAAGRTEGATNSATVTNTVEPPAAKFAEYQRVRGTLESLRKREQDLLEQFTTESSMVKRVQEQIAANEKSKKELEDAYPRLLDTALAGPKRSASDNAQTGGLDLNAELARITGLQSKIRTLTERLDKLRKETAAVYETEASITDLTRKKELQEANFKYIAASLEQSKIDEALGSGRISNISRVQAPSPPYRVVSRLYKVLALVLFGSIFASLALAFALEFYVDQSIKRPAEVEAKIGVPLFMSIPWMRLNGNGASHNGANGPALLTGGCGDVGPANGNGHEIQLGEGAELTAWAPSHLMQPFCEALRDRMITLFELKNLTHKPKLVAVTSCAERSGVSTVAAGLAAALSETGDGNVLLVDMNVQNGAARQFRRGELACDLDVALEQETRDYALVQDNLYVVTESNGNGLPSALPTRFRNLVPRLKASDYDYIIFDMPAVNRVSVTPRLAKFMDMVLMVVESEKTDAQMVKRASALLAQAETNLGIVLNKAREYLPKGLRQDL